MSFPFRYRLGPEGVEVRLLGRTLRRVRYDDIESVRFGHAAWNEHWTNVWPWRFLTLRRKSGWIRDFVINPPRTEAFAAALRARLAGEPYDESLEPE